MNVLVMVLAGGNGKRLYPLTRDRAKPAVPFGGIYRIIDFTLSNCINSGLRNILVLTQYKSDSLSRHIRRGWRLFDSEFGEVYVVPPQQRIGAEWYRGTADAVCQNLHTIERGDCDYVIILAGDHIYKMDFAKMLDFHVERRAHATVGAVEVGLGGASSYGIIEVNAEQRIIGFEEKPESPKNIPGKVESAFASMGIYIFNKNELINALMEDTNAGDSSHDFGGDIIPKMIEKRAVYAYNFKDENKKEAKYWRDVGTLDAYFEANMDLLEIDPVLNLYDLNWPIRTCLRQYPPPKFVFAREEEDRMGFALDSIVSSGSIIRGGRVNRSILSPGVRINSWSDVNESILFEEVKVGRGAKIRRAIIDKGVRIPEGMEIGYDPEEDRKRFMVSQGGVIVIPKEEDLSHLAKIERPLSYPKAPLEKSIESIGAEKSMVIERG